MSKNYREKTSLLRVSIRSMLAGLSVLLLSAAIGTELKAQVSAYVFSQNIGTFTPITGGTVLGTATGNTSATNLNSQVYSVTLPFAFNFNQQSYTELNVSSNGFVTFGATAPSATLSAPISSSIAYEGAIAAFARDLTSFYDIAGRTGNIRWETVGTAPNREVVIQWTDFRPTNTTSTTSVYAFSFQIRLQETTNIISTVYTSGSYLIGSTSYSSSVNQIGLRGATNSDFNNRYNPTGTLFINSEAGTSNGLDQSFSTVNVPPGMPADGLTYTWTPPTCFSPVSFTPGSVTLGTAVVNWTAPAQVPALGYDIYYNTTGIAPDSSTVLDGTNSLSVSSSALSATLSGLSSGTQYYIWIRGKCSSSDFGNWSAGITLATECVPVNAPYTQDFDTAPSGSSTNNTAPVCWTYYEESGSAAYGYVSTSNSVSAPHSFYMYNSSDTTGNILLISPQTLNLSDGTKWVKFSARGSGSTSILEVGTLDSPTNLGSLSLLTTIPLTNSHQEYTVMIPAGTHQYLVFRHGLGGTYRGIYMDNITVENAPTCFEPTALSVTAGSVTGSGGTVSWVAPSTPATGYEIYYSTDPTPPVAGTVLDGTNSLSVVGTTATLSGLNPSTVYYVWVRSVCSASDKSVWTPTAVTMVTLCQPPVISATTVNPVPVCVGGTATITATADAGAQINWYANATDTTPLATGATFTTGPLNVTTDFYVSSGSGTTGNVGPASPSSLGTISASNYAIGTYYQIFDVLTPVTLNSVDVYPASTVAIGTASSIEIRDSSGTTLVSVPYTVAVNDGVTPQTVTLNYLLPVGTGYRIGQGVGINLQRNTSGANYPFTSPAINVTGNNFTSGPNYWYYIYNWNYSTGCESARSVVTVTVDPNCTMGTSEAGNTKEPLIYPNPFTDVVNFSDFRSVKSVTVLDMSGRVLRTIDNPGAQINLRELRSGMYILKLDYKDATSKSMKAIKK
ncbi:fibronectin type III domain-containing protein [Chryseobacterium sp.]|uniref:fibronectin type III domain-containing protein n=1 Tax=Chryseobacterium sp. TaxID=1871047 RepID=UPI0012A84B14|nr:fibronectin type III domain-containing protein [Chryseobacterium sp.]QFG53579.1 T9SS type A sorting domain-containing protein [Chryseobacterium sp.]